jgi:hypothetical protein
MPSSINATVATIRNHPGLKIETLAPQVVESSAPIRPPWTRFSKLRTLKNKTRISITQTIKAPET